MFLINLKIALRNLRRNKLYALINILGLSIGMTIYLFAGLIVDYERTHDAFFVNSDRTYLVGSYIAESQNLDFDVSPTAYTAVGPIVRAELADVEAVARTVARQYLISTGDTSLYSPILFSDSALLDIFDFNYIDGGKDALSNPSSILLTETAAIRYFGDTKVVGEILTLDNQYPFQVAAVIEDIPSNSHFMSLPRDPSGIFAPLSSLEGMGNISEIGEWDSLSTGNNTYILLPSSLDATWLETQLGGIFDRFASDATKTSISGFYVTPLEDFNISMWGGTGLPVVNTLLLLSFLVLVIACVNYTNLGTAQSLGRSREVGMRKTMGATKSQLLAQFLVESLAVATIAMIITIAALEILIGLFNNQALQIDYLSTLPWIVVTTLWVGLLAGFYPAWLITRASPIDALNDLVRRGKNGSLMRGLMISIQFGISAFMLALVAVVFMQNQKTEEESYTFPRSEIYTLSRLGVAEIQSSLTSLQFELEALPNVNGFALSSQIPFQGNHDWLDISKIQGDEAGEFRTTRMAVSPEFFGIYDVPLLAGRNLSKEIANDEFKDTTSEVLNVIVNEMTLSRLGIDTPAEAINRRFFVSDDAFPQLKEAVIVGVVPTLNIISVYGQGSPWVFYYHPAELDAGSIRISGGGVIETLRSIENVWRDVIPNYPIQGNFLDAAFEQSVRFIRRLSVVLSGIAFVAFSLAMVGQFGLAAFLAEQRTKEIGVRKALGASSMRILWILVWQFSKPAVWALMVALPAAYFASINYLNFFSDRMSSLIPILIIAGFMAVLLAWIAVAWHAQRVARANPISALRYE